MNNFLVIPVFKALLFSIVGGNSGVKVSNSFKHDRTRATSVPARPAQVRTSL